MPTNAYVIGGEHRTRTCDPLKGNRLAGGFLVQPDALRMVARGGFEPPASRSTGECIAS
jgi:hypothetical protein